MKDYPQISQSTGMKFQEIPAALIFDKLDGSNMRSEWSSKKGWYKHGRRNGLLDSSNPQLLVVPDLFSERLSEPLAKIAMDNQWQSLIVFYEFWGQRSLAGIHQADDPKFLTLFDAVADKKGFIDPVDFRRFFEGKVETARYLGTENWTRGYVQRVREGKVDGITFEGVVAKGGTRHRLVRAKAKTQKWIDAVLALYGTKEGTAVINS